MSDPAPALTGQQRRRLRALAHGRKAVVHVGDGGVGPGVLDAIDRALHDHELVKVRLHQPEDKKATARLLADEAGAALCGLVGHTVILYRPHPEKPRILLSAPEGEPDL